MKLKYFIIFFAITLCLFTVWYFMSKGNKLLTSGQLIYANTGNGNFTLSSIDVRSKKIDVLYEDKATDTFSTYTSYVSKLDSNWILLSRELFVKGAALPKYVIEKFNIETKKTTLLTRGINPVYLPRYNKILFFSSDNANSYPNGLYVADINKVNEAKLVIKCPNQHNKIVPISDNEVVFQSNKETEKLLYDVKTNKISVLPIKNCGSCFIWRNRTKQLICYSLDKRKYVLIGLDGKKETTLPLKEREIPTTYSPEKDMLILMVEGVKDLSPVWHIGIYDFATGKKEILSKYNGFSDGIYLAEKASTELK